MIEHLLIEYSHIPERRADLESRLRNCEKLKERVNNLTEGMKCRQELEDEFQHQLDYYSKGIAAYNEKERRIIEVLKILLYDEYRVIEMRYFNKYSWEKIARLLPASRSTCFYIKDNALSKLGKIII